MSMNENETPTSISLDNLSVDENSSGAHIANISGVDPDGDELTYNIEGIGDYHMVHITDNVLHLNDNISADYENKQQLEVTLRAEDPGGLYTEQFFTIDVLNDPSDDPPSNQAPTSLNIEIMSVYENLVGEELGLISAYDPDGDDLIFELSGFYSEHFELIPYEGSAITLDGWQGVTLKLNDNWSFDYENQLNYFDRTLTINVSDPEELFVEANFEFQVLDDISDNINEIDTTPPVLTSFEIFDTSLSVEEQITVNFNATDDSALRRYNGEFTYIDDTGYHHKLSFFGTPVLMPDGSYNTHSLIIPSNSPSGDYTLTRFFIQDLNDNEYWRDSSETFWSDVNTTITVTNPNEVIIDTTPPILTSFEIFDTSLSVEEQITVNFNATDDSALRRYDGAFTYIDDTGYNHILRLVGTPVLMPDGSYNTHSLIIPSNSPSGDYTLTYFRIKDVNDNEYNRDTSESVWSDVNTTITVTNPNDIINVSDDPETTTFTASIDKWQLGGDQTSSTWLDGPSMKLHRKDESATETITHVVTVAAGENVYGPGNKYLIDGVVSPSLDFISGKTYEFDLSAVPGSHPFQFSTLPNGTFGGGSIFEDVSRTADKLTITINDDTPDLHYFCENHLGMGGSTSIIDNSIDLTAKDGHPGHKHKPDMDKGEYELRVEHNQQTDGAIDIDDVMGVLSLSRGKSSPASKEHKLAADWNGDGIIDIDDVMGVLARSRGKSKEDEWRFHDKTSDTSLWDNATKTNKMDIVLER